jgi:hypothetical protein
MDARWDETKRNVESLALSDWREATLRDAIRDAATLIQRYSDTDTTRRDTRTGAFVTTDGRILYANAADRDRSRDAMLQGIIAHRRTLRGLRRATLRNSYRGSVTRDGIAIAPPMNVTMRLAQIDRAIALSDTFVTRDGVTTAILSRGPRDAEGMYDGTDALALARIDRKGR